MQVKNIDARLTLNGDYELILTVPRKEEKTVFKLVEEFKSKSGKTWEANIGVKRKKRSLDANSYLWVICSKIADVLKSTKEEIYMEAVRKKGMFEIVPIHDNALEFWINAWKSKGLGWHSEVFAKAKTDGYTNTINYYGSSVYDSKTMSVLIDYIVGEAKELGIETLPFEELERMKGEWNK